MLYTGCSTKKQCHGFFHKAPKISGKLTFTNTIWVNSGKSKYIMAKTESSGIDLFLTTNYFCLSKKYRVSMISIK